MKKHRENTCEICGKNSSVVISGRNIIERFCSRCLVAVYPALKELTKELRVT